jgi:plastocyanin
MFNFGKHKSAFLGSGLMLTLAAALGGCGGQGTGHDDAVVTPDPTVTINSGKTAAPTAGSPVAGAPGAAPSAAAPSAAPAAAVTASGWGTLKGQIKFDGPAPALKVLQTKGKADKNPEICASQKDIVSERLVVDDASKGVKNVLVYFPRPTAVNEDAKKAAVATPILFDQKNCVFEPHVVGMMAGTPVTLKSSDSTNHNVNIKLKVSAFNQTIPPGGSTEFKTQGPERSPGQVVCDIHNWMTSWWMVIDNPYIAVTDASGNFEIKNVPAGTQKVVVWQEAVGYVTPSSGKDVTIKPSESNVENFTIDPAKVRPEN